MFKPIRLSDQTTCVSLNDPAIDPDASDLKAYGKAAKDNPACWRELLKMRAGQEPTVFEIGVVPPGELTRIMDECVNTKATRYEEAAWRCFLAGVRGIRSWSDDPPRVKRDGVEYVDPAWLAKTFARGLRAIAVEIGSFVYHWNQLTEDEIKN